MDVDPTELALIGAMIVDIEIIDIASSRLTKKDFGDSGLGSIFEQLVLLRDARKPINDMAFLGSHLTSCGLIGRDGGTHFGLGHLARAVHQAVPHNADHYITQIIRRAMLTDQRLLMNEIASKLDSPGADPADIARMIESKVSVIMSRESSSVQPIYEHALVAVERVRESVSKARVIGATTGLPSLDTITGGMPNKEMIVLAARPSNGKTSLAMQIALHAAIQGRRILFVSLEMPGADLAQRILSKYASVPSSVIRNGTVTMEHVARMEVEANNLRGIRLEVFDAARVGMRQIRGMSRVMHSTGGLDLLLIDYIGLVKPSDVRAPRHEQVGEISKQVKALAKELDIPVIVMAQLNREAANDKPKNSHLRDSGSIEEDADQIWLLHNPPDKPPGEAAELIVGKNRNGSTGVHRMTWKAESTSFVDFVPVYKEGLS
jgi:replicative DNA helicase